MRQAIPPCNPEIMRSHKGFLNIHCHINFSLNKTDSDSVNNTLHMPCAYTNTTKTKKFYILFNQSVVYKYGALHLRQYNGKSFFWNIQAFLTHIQAQQSFINTHLQVVQNSHLTRNKTVKTGTLQVSWNKKIWYW